MMLKTILSISGKPGLYKLVSKGKNMLIVEALSAGKKRFPVHSSEKVISLGDIALYTDEEEAPLKDVLTSIKEKEKGAVLSIDVKKASPDELRDYLSGILPNYDRERVHANDIRKLISWYNILITSGITDFREKEEEASQPDIPAE